MTNDLPIYSDSVFRSANPFPALAKIREGDVARCLERFDTLLDHGEDAGNVAGALKGIRGATKQELLRLHGALFESRNGAGRLRTTAIAATFPGQDCPDPRFLERSLENFEQWLRVESLSELHPIQRAALTLTRLIDIWPFDFGNRTTAVVFANWFLVEEGLPPFFVPAGQIEEFEQILSQAVLMQTEALVRAIYKCMERELELVRQ